MCGLQHILPLFLTVALAGCLSSGQPSGLPVGAILVAEGFSPLQFSAASMGRVYVWDQADHRIVFETDLQPHDDIWLDVITGRVGIDFKPAKDPRTGDYIQIGSYVRHQIFFSPARNTATQASGH